MKIKRLACRARFTLIATALVIPPAFAESAAPPLGAYNADIKESSISGISSGAFMAVQFGVAWSSIVKGVGVIAGGPFYCAQGKAADALFGNLGPESTATGPCTVISASVARLKRLGRHDPKPGSPGVEAV